MIKRKHDYTINTVREKGEYLIKYLSVTRQQRKWQREDFPGNFLHSQRSPSEKFGAPIKEGTKIRVRARRKDAIQASGRSETHRQEKRTPRRLDGGSHKIARKMISNLPTTSEPTPETPYKHNQRAESSIFFQRSKVLDYAYCKIKQSQLWADSSLARDGV